MISVIAVHAQLKIFLPTTPRDSNYIYNYSSSITVRAGLSDKYTNFSIGGNEYNRNTRLRYLTNKPLSIGVGAVYKIYNVNIGVGLPSYVSDASAKGKTRSLDLHTSMYGRKWVYDIFGQFYKGFYTRNHDPFLYTKFISRPDIRVRMIGGTANYLFNNAGFSYRAFRINDEWQHKSAGTFSLNFSLLTGVIQSTEDMGFIPVAQAAAFPEGNVKDMRYVQFGPGAGYAYNFVYKRNYFLLLSANAKGLVEWGRETTVDDQQKSHWTLQPGVQLLGAIGYQNSRWGINFSALNTRTWSQSQVYNTNYRMDVGVVKLTVLKRLNHSDFSRKVLRPFDKLLEK